MVDYSLLEKINTNIQNPLYSINIIGWSFLFILQLFWIQHTVLKIYKLIPLSNTYEEKEKQLFAFVSCLHYFYLTFWTDHLYKVFLKQIGRSFLNAQTQEGILFLSSTLLCKSYSVVFPHSISTTTETLI